METNGADWLLEFSYILKELRMNNFFKCTAQWLAIRPLNKSDRILCILLVN